MGQTATFNLPYPEAPDPADVPADLEALAEAVDQALAGAAAIPGELKMWPGAVVPEVDRYGLWVWADGSAYNDADYPQASVNISAAWKTAHGQASPGAGKFRVPDLRGLSPVGMDAMPGGPRANRSTRSVAITIAARTGEEYHTIQVAEMPPHAHGVNDPGHAHGVGDPGHAHYIDVFNHSYLVEVPNQPGNYSQTNDFGSTPNNANIGYAKPSGTGIWIGGAGTGIWLSNNGSGGAHENMPPSVYVPWVVKLDD